MTGKRFGDILSGKNDTVKVREDYKAQKKCAELWIDPQGKKPPAPYVIDESGKERVWSWLLSVKLPSSFGMAAVKVFQALHPGELQRQYLIQLTTAPS